METNPQQLLVRLQAYHTGIQRHLATLSQSHDALTLRWQALSSTFEGAAADQFRVGWQRTNQGFQTYQSGTADIAQLLEQRLEQLQQYQQPEEL